LLLGYTPVTTHGYVHVPLRLRCGYTFHVVTVYRCSAVCYTLRLRLHTPFVTRSLLPPAVVHVTVTRLVTVRLLPRLHTHRTRSGSRVYGYTPVVTRYVARLIRSRVTFTTFTLLRVYVYGCYITFILHTFVTRLITLRCTLRLRLLRVTHVFTLRLFTRYVRYVTFTYRLYLFWLHFTAHVYVTGYGLFHTFTLLPRYVTFGYVVGCGLHTFTFTFDSHTFTFGYRTFYGCYVVGYVYVGYVRLRLHAALRLFTFTLHTRLHGSLRVWFVDFGLHYGYVTTHTTLLFTLRFITDLRSHVRLRLRLPFRWLHYARYTAPHAHVTHGWFTVTHTHTAVVHTHAHGYVTVWLLVTRLVPVTFYALVYTLITFCCVCVYARYVYTVGLRLRYVVHVTVTLRSRLRFTFTLLPFTFTFTRFTPHLLFYAVYLVGYVVTVTPHTHHTFTCLRSRLRSYLVTVVYCTFTHGLQFTTRLHVYVLTFGYGYCVCGYHGYGWLPHCGCYTRLLRSLVYGYVTLRLVYVGYTVTFCTHGLLVYGYTFRLHTCVLLRFAFVHVYGYHHGSARLVVTAVCTRTARYTYGYGCYVYGYVYGYSCRYVLRCTVTRFTRHVCYGLRYGYVYVCHTLRSTYVRLILHTLLDYLRYVAFTTFTYVTVTAYV